MENVKAIGADNLQEAVESPNLNLNSFIEENSLHIFTNNDLPYKFVEIQIDNDFEVLSTKNALKILEYSSQRDFFLHVRFVTKSSLYWIKKDIKLVFNTECEKPSNISEFIKEFLILDIHNGGCGILPDVVCEAHQLINFIDISLIGDERGFNLLFLAAEAGNAKVVQSLLEDGMNVSYLVDGKIPADIAYEKKHLDVLLCLLKANSRFPRDFEMQEEANDCNSMLQISLNLRQAVLNEDKPLAEEILNSNKNLRYFYDTNNQSILTYALVNKKFEMYEFLMMLNFTFGPREDFEKISELFSEEEQESLMKLHQKSSRKFVEKHLMTLMANSFVANDNDDPRDKLHYAFNAFEYLNDIPVAKPILKAIAARRDFDIHFDFNRDSVVYLDPSQAGANGLCFFINRQILISAKGLLDPSTRNEVYGVLIHELTHFAMALVYKNRAKPYGVNDLITAHNFENINKFCKSNMEREALIESVYDDYPVKVHHQELIVRSPHLLAHYNEDEEKLSQSKEDFAPLHDFFEKKVIPDVEAAIPRIENEAAEAYNKALRKKISRLQKTLWFLGIFFIFFSTALALFLYEPVYSWNGLNPIERNKILNSSVSYKGIDVKLKNLMANDSDGFQYFNSNYIKNALNGDLKSLNHALNTNLDQYIFLSPSNLTEEFWDKILNSSVNFQGQNVSLNDTASNTSVLNQLSSKQIKTLLCNESIDIGTKIEFTSFYIPRKFVGPDDFVLNTSSEVFNFVKDSKIFLLADKPGSGKSVSFQALQKEFKESNPEYWIEFIELKNFYGVFESVQNSNVDIIADKILNLKGLDRDIFIDQFENGKVILLWDGVDEIAPDFDDGFISFAFNIFSSTSNIQLISTRPQYAAKISNTFNSYPQSLVEYTEEDRNDFINGYLDSVEISNQSKHLKVYDQVIGFIDNIQSIESNSLRDDINNPLMLKMLVDIAISNKLSKDLDNIYKVYDEFIKLKLKVISGKGSIIIDTALIAAVDISISEIHMIHALKYIFGYSFDNYFNNTQIHTDKLWNVNKKDTLADHELSSYGVILKLGSKIDFVHRTFAEFFVAKYLIENIYESKSHLQVEDMKMQIALLHNVAFNIYVRKVIQEFILNFIESQKSNDKKFEGSIIEVMKNYLGNIHNYFVLQERAPMFIKFFEKDERVMRILAKVDQYENINDWLNEVLGISLGDKKSFIENNQLGLILMRAWQFESQGNKIFADFITKSTKIFDESNRSLRPFSEKNETGLSNETLLFPNHEYRNITEQSILLLEADTVSEWLKITTTFLHIEELKQIFINSVHIIDIDFVNINGSLDYIHLLNMTLNQEEIVSALTKTNFNNETLFYHTLRIDHEPFNDQILLLVEENLDDEEILELFTKPEINYNSTLLMIAAQFQDRVIFQKLINFTKSHVTEDQFRLILLQRDILNDTILQYSNLFLYDDNFVFIVGIYHDILTKNEIRETFTNRANNKLPSFGENLESTSDENSINIAHFLDYIFTGDDDALLELLSRRNENGDTIFSLYKNVSRLQNKLKAYKTLLNVALATKKNKEEIMKNLFITDPKFNA